MIQSGAGEARPARPSLTSRRGLLFGAAAAVAAVPATIVATRAEALPYSSLDGPRARFFPNVELVSHRGEKVRFYDDLIHNRTVLINFMYTQCSETCPAQSFNLSAVQEMLGDRLGKDIVMHSITLKPEEDSPAELARFASKYQPRAGWNFLTGKPEELDVLRRLLGFWLANPDEDSIKTRHTGLFRYGNARYDRWAACPSLQSSRAVANALLWMSGDSTGASLV